MRTPHVNRSTKKIYSAAKIIIDKTEIFFCQTSWKDGLSKKIGMEYDLSCIIGKDDMILLPERKMKDDLSQKNTWKCDDIFFKCSEMMVFSKIALEYDLSCIIWKDGIFSRKYDIFSLERKWKKIFLKEYMETWYFLYIRIGATNTAPCPSSKKNQRWSYPAKMHLQVVGILDWHP